MKMGVYLVIMFLASVARLGMYVDHQHSLSKIDVQKPNRNLLVLPTFFYFTSLKRIILHVSVRNTFLFEAQI